MLGCHGIVRRGDRRGTKGGNSPGEKKLEFLKTVSLSKVTVVLFQLRLVSTMHLVPLNGHSTESNPTSGTNGPYRTATT